MKISRSYTGIGAEDWAPYLTLNIFPHKISEFTVHHTDRSGELRVRVEDGNPVCITLDGEAKPHLLRVRLDQSPARISRDGLPLDAGSWSWIPESNRLIVKSDTPVSGNYDIYFDKP